MEFQAHVHSLNGLDYVVLGIILLSGLLALARGFVREVLSLAAWTGAYFAAVRLYPQAEPLVREHIHNPTAVSVVAGVAVFVAALILFSLIGFLIARLVQGRGLTLIDRSLGFAFGVMRGALVVCIVYMAVVAMLWPDLDKPKPPETMTAAAPVAPVAPAAPMEQKEARQEEKDSAPSWLVKAKTRPALAYGAQVLKSFIPEHAGDKTSAAFMQEKINAQRAIDDHLLDKLSTPTPAAAKAVEAPTYDDSSRNTLNHLVDQKASP